MYGHFHVTGISRWLLLILFCVIPRSCAQGKSSTIPQWAELQAASLIRLGNSTSVKLEAYRITDEEDSIEEAWLPDFQRYRLQVLEFYASLDDHLAWVQDSKP